MNTQEQQLWNIVEKIWDITMAQDLVSLERALHPAFSGWVKNSDTIVDYAAALASTGPGTPLLLHYDLTPMKVTIFEKQTGVVHYRYRAEIEQQDKKKKIIQGCWTEVYTYKEGNWLLAAVSGGPDSE